LVKRDVPVEANAAPGVEEVARLEALRRLATGAAHAMNNAFTAVLGEASFLLEDRKDDPELSEACEVILREMERCTRLTRALLARRGSATGAPTQIELVRLLCDLGPLLGETLGSHKQLVVEVPDSLVHVESSAETLEVLVLSLVHFACDRTAGASQLRLSLDADEATRIARLDLEVRGEDPVGDSAATLLDPALATDAMTRTQLHAIEWIVSALGGRLHATAVAPDAWSARVTFPILDLD